MPIYDINDIDEVIEEEVNTVSFVIDTNTNNIASVTFTDAITNIVQTRNVNSNGLSSDDLNTRCKEVAWGIKHKLSVGVSPTSNPGVEE